MADISVDEMRDILHDVTKPIIDMLVMQGKLIEKLDFNLQQMDNRMRESIKDIGEVVKEHSILESKFINHENRQDKDIETIQKDTQSNWNYTYALNDRVNVLQNCVDVMKEANRNRDESVKDIQSEASWIKANIWKLSTLGTILSGVGYTAFKGLAE